MERVNHFVGDVPDLEIAQAWQDDLLPHTAVVRRCSGRLTRQVFGSVTLEQIVDGWQGTLCGRPGSLVGLSSKRIDTGVHLPLQLPGLLPGCSGGPGREPADGEAALVAGHDVV